MDAHHESKLQRCIELAIPGTGYPLPQPSLRAGKTDADNGMENSSSRTQFIKRLVEFAGKNSIKINLAYFPPVIVNTSN